MSIQVTSTTDPKSAALASNPGLATTDTEKEDTKSASQEETQEDENKEASDASSDLEDSDENEADSQDEDKPKDDEENQEGEKKPKQKGFKKRIDKLNKRLSDKDQELEYWKRQAIKGKDAEQDPQQKLTQKEATSPDDKPKSENFETHAEYLEALTDWKVDQREKAKEAKQRETEVKTQFQKQEESFRAKVAEFKKEQSDYDEVIADFIEEHGDITFSPGLHELIMTSDLGPAIAYELAKNKEELDRINALSPLVAAREIGKLELRLSKDSESSKKPEIKTTKAPPPLKPVGGNGSAKIAKSISDPNISQRDYERLRREQIAKYEA